MRAARLRLITLQPLGIGLLLALLFSVGSIGKAAASAQPAKPPEVNTITLSASNIASTYSRNRFYIERLLSRVFSTAGYQLQFVFMPTARADTQADRGFSDGTIRLSQNLQHASEALPVPEPLCFMYFYAHAIKTMAPSNYWEDIKDPRVISSYQPAALFQQLPARLRQHPPILVPSIELGIRSLLRGEGNLLLFADNLAAGTESLFPKNAQKEVLQLHPYVTKVPAYLWLNKRFQPLFPQLVHFIQTEKQTMLATLPIDNPQEDDVNCTQLLAD